MFMHLCGRLLLVAFEMCTHLPIYLYCCTTKQLAAPAWLLAGFRGRVYIPHGKSEAAKRDKFHNRRFVLMLPIRKSLYTFANGRLHIFITAPATLKHSILQTFRKKSLTELSMLFLLYFG